MCLSLGIGYMAAQWLFRLSSEGNPHTGSGLFHWAVPQASELFLKL